MNKLQIFLVGNQLHSIDNSVSLMNISLTFRLPTDIRVGKEGSGPTSFMSVFMSFLTSLFTVILLNRPACSVAK